MYAFPEKNDKTAKEKYLSMLSKYLRCLLAFEKIYE